MHYLAVGLTCLCAVAYAGGRRGLAAALAALAGFGCAFLVYRDWVPPAAAVAAIAAGYPLSLGLRRTRWIGAAGLAGAALVAFSLLGPADGLF